MENGSIAFSQYDYIQEGANPSPGAIVIACTIGNNYDNPKNRVVVKRNDIWLEFRTSGESVLSIDASDDGMAFVLGENGSVIEFDWKTPKTQDELRASRKLYFIDRVANIGPLRRIRLVNGELFCVGSVGQVYHLNNGKFIVLPKVRIDDEEPTIEDISGTGLNDLIVVTSDGFAAQYNGSVWDKVDLPTNVSLTSICRFKEDRYAIAGKKGTIVTGYKNQWKLITSTNPDRNYWGIAGAEGSLYAAHLAGIDLLQKDSLIPLDIPDSEKMEFTVLVNGPDGVWSFCGHTIGLITVDGWKTILHW
jgi:hypothetical protein